jgi:hypothetical protein
MVTLGVQTSSTYHLFLFSFNPLLIVRDGSQSLFASSSMSNLVSGFPGERICENSSVDLSN